MITPTSPLLTDLYQLTMMQAYHDCNMNDEAVFEFFVRKLPPARPFLVACGLEQVLEYLLELRFSEEDLDYLRQDGRFHEQFLQSLAALRFTGSVHGMAEGTIFFPDEPIIRITAPLPVAQLVETRIINILQFQTMIASKAVQMRRVLPESILVDYGLRRAHGAEAGVMASRASYLAGFDGTATVLAGKMFDIPIFGTMAHSFIQAHDSEIEAFTHFNASFPDNTIFLLDTYDTLAAAKKVVKLAHELGQQTTIRGVRLDSGDMISLSKEVRQILDDGGLHEVKIFASGSLDETSLVEYREKKAPVDGFGIGSKLTTSADAPYFDCAYKLVEYAGRGRRKFSTSKVTWPGRKQVFRTADTSGTMSKDLLTLDIEDHAGTPLIQEYMRYGEQVTSLPVAETTRKFITDQLGTLPKDIHFPDFHYPVFPSELLQKFSERVSRQCGLTPNKQ